MHLLLPNENEIKNLFLKQCMTFGEFKNLFFVQKRKIKYLK